MICIYNCLTLVMEIKFVSKSVSNNMKSLQWKHKSLLIDKSICYEVEDITSTFVGLNENSLYCCEQPEQSKNQMQKP